MTSEPKVVMSSPTPFVADLREIIQSCDPPLGDLGANLDAYAGQRTLVSDRPLGRPPVAKDSQAPVVSWDIRVQHWVGLRPRRPVSTMAQVESHP